MADETMLNKALDNRLDETVLNKALNNDSDETVLNKALDNDSDKTMLNKTLNNESNKTLLNTDALSKGSVMAGQKIGRYLITERMNVKTGEADLYRCTADGTEYVLKHYRRKSAVKLDILSQLKEMDSPYIARLVDAGYYNDRPYEITLYYANGSVQGRRYSFQELKEVIIPELNEALKQLHDRKIIHKDLKPSNIMLCDNGRDIALIDFGISSMKEDDNTIILTKTGFTPDYTAHEAFNGLFLNESDYYSMGITLYELYTGTTPYKNMDAEQIAMYTAVQKIPLSDDMEQELKDLIAALTYYDITNRKDKSNPNRRWTYEEVKKWCENVPQPIPGTAAAAENRQKGSTKGNGSQANEFVWKGQHYNSLESFGKDIQDRLWKSKRPDMSIVDDILKNRALSAYLENAGAAEQMRVAIDALETGFIEFYRDVRQRTKNYYLLGYMLSGRKVFYKNEKEYESVEMLVEYLKELLNVSYKKFEEFCEALIDDEGRLNIQFECWLTALGKNDQIKEWRKRLS